MRFSGRSGAVAVLVGVGMLTACGPAPPSVQSVASPSQSEASPPAAVRPPGPTGPSKGLTAESSLYYRDLAVRMSAQGLLRRDGGAQLTPSDHIVSRNFIDIALYDEYTAGVAGLVARKTPSRLARWERPIRYHLSFGSGQSAEIMTRDRAMIAQYLERLSTLTGVEISPTAQDTAANFHIAILSEAERKSAQGYLKRIAPGIDRQTIQALTDFDRDTNCAVAAFSHASEHGYLRAVTIIRDEIPPAFRQACVHEELAQAMGLSNDSPRARPSIFNDDEEFATLTAHDAYLLQILYDPRLSSGMDRSEAEPIVRQIARELLDDGRAN